MLRTGLDRLYLWSGYLSAVCLVSIALTVIAQVLGRFVGVAVDSTESAGFMLAGGTFFGLAHTFTRGDHIRVTLVTRLASGWVARGLALWSIGCCVLVMGMLTWWAADLVYFSHKFGDVSPGLLAVPFWIPRSTMALGACVFTIALVDEFVRVARGGTPSYEANAAPLFSAEVAGNDASVANDAGQR